jgi:hypothetical protein
VRYPRIRTTLVLALTMAATLLVPGPSASGGGSCDAIDTAPAFAGRVPTATSVLGFPLGQQEVTVRQAWTYLDAVDSASGRVASGTYAVSVDGRDLRYAVVGRPRNVSPDGLEAIRQNILKIRDPDTSAADAAALAATTPAFLYVAGNVHGTEEAGADASLRVLYELADRTDCAARRILDNAVVFILPIQNPDGRQADTRRNAYGIDLNRDWSTRSQPETDGKIELLRTYPPSLFVDAHEFGYTRSFFPPNDDPVYHEVSDQVLGWINGRYGPALEDLFAERGWGFFHGGGYDFFAPIYGDTVPSDGFQAAGITLEQNAGAPIALRVQKYHDEMWVLLSEAADGREGILDGQHAAYVQAVREGANGVLEPNAVYRSSAAPRVQVPRYRVRHYFFWDPGARARETALLVRSLQRMDVSVYQLTAPLEVPYLRPYVGTPGPQTIPAGAYWVPMAQAQKHWIQAMLNRSTYVPVKKTYDVTGWSLPLLYGVAGGSSGAELSPEASPAAPVPADPGIPAPADPPTIGLLELSRGVYSFESTGWLRSLLDTQWHVPFQTVTTDDVRAGGLAGVDELVVAGGGVQEGLKRLRPRGIRELTSWVQGGGRFLGWRYGGGLLASKIGLIDARIQNASTGIEGALIRIRFDPSSPLVSGTTTDQWIMFDGDDVIRQAPRSTAAARYPIRSDLQVSGFAPRRGKDMLGGTAAVIDQPVGAGRAIVLPFDPNYRLYTVGMQQVVWNALFGSDP